MLEIKKIESLNDISELKKQYFALSTAPLDGMWHFGFVAMAEHFGFYENNAVVGYCCINSDGYMLQFYLSPAATAHASDLFSLIAEHNSTVIGEINGAFVSTAEADYLSLCLDNSASFKVNSLMYLQTDNSLKQTNNSPKQTKDQLNMVLAETADLDNFVTFAASNIGAPEQWLAGYYTNLIERKELWGYWKHDQLQASGECRLFDEYQTEYADLGMIVAESVRGQGIASQVLSYLVRHANKQGLQAMCSTESSNIGAQKAIRRAGLRSSNRINQFEFNPA